MANGSISSTTWEALASLHGARAEPIGAVLGNSASDGPLGSPEYHGSLRRPRFAVLGRKAMRSLPRPAHLDPIVSS